MDDAEDVLKAKEEARIKTREKQAHAQWKMIPVVAGQLRFFAMLDLCLQIFYQLPIIEVSKTMADAGFRKIWSVEDAAGPITRLKFPQLIDSVGTNNEIKFLIDKQNLLFQIMNCIIIAFIVLQNQVFSSSGYVKFVTQSDGSMDLLMKLAETKAKAITQCRNNYKLRKILSLQRRHDTILAVVDKIKEKVVRWRMFTRTTLVVEDKSKQLPAPVEEEPQTPASAIVENPLTRQKTSKLEHRRVDQDEDETPDKVDQENDEANIEDSEQELQSVGEQEELPKKKKKVGFAEGTTTKPKKATKKVTVEEA